MNKAKFVSVQLFFPSTEEGRDYELDGLMNFVHPSGEVDLDVVYPLLRDAMVSAGYEDREE